MKTAVVYARYSSDRQTEQSIEGQLHVCQKFAENNDIVIVDTYIDRAKQTKICIHRLVATTFLDNPKALKEVNHKDEDKTNNRVDNLEWCSHLYNMNYGNIKKKISDGNKGKKLSDTHRRKVGIASSQHRWVHKESVERFVYLSEIDKFLLDGWRIGRTFKRRGMYV